MFFLIKFLCFTLLTFVLNIAPWRSKNLEINFNWSGGNEAWPKINTLINWIFQLNLQSMIWVLFDIKSCLRLIIIEKNCEVDPFYFNWHLCQNKRTFLSVSRQQFALLVFYFNSKIGTYCSMKVKIWLYLYACLAKKKIIFFVYL